MLSLCNTFYPAENGLWGVAEFNYGDILDITFYEFMQKIKFYEFKQIETGKILKTKALEIQELKELVTVKSLPGRY